MVDRHRARRDPHLGDPAAPESEMADLDQSICRGNDVIRRGLRGSLPGISYGPSVARLLAVPVPQCDGDLAPIPLAADVGRLCGIDLRDRVAAVLVRRVDTRSRNTSRPGQE